MIVGIISFEEGQLHIIDNIYLLIYCLFWISIHEINEIYCIIGIWQEVYCFLVS